MALFVIISIRRDDVVNDIVLASALLDCLNSLHITESTKSIADEAMLKVLGPAVTPVELQVMLSEFEDSRVKFVWANSFASKYGMSLLDFTKEAMLLVMTS